MNTVPIFDTVKNDPMVNSLLKTGDILRVFEFGIATDHTPTPYVVWQLISGWPENYITCTPTIEEHLIQIDCYAQTQSMAKQVATAMEAVIEKVAKITSYRRGYETETKVWRASFDAHWHVKR